MCAQEVGEEVTWCVCPCALKRICILACREHVCELIGLHYEVHVRQLHCCACKVHVCEGGCYISSTCLRYRITLNVHV